MTDSPTILRASTGADLLALLPYLAGGPITRSVAIVPFVGRRTPAVVRYPLPDDLSATALAAIATHLVGTVSRLGGCDAVAIAIYADEKFDVALPRYATFERTLLQQFLAAGFSVHDTFCVAGDGWSPFDEAHQRNLNEIAASPLHRAVPDAVRQERHPDGRLPQSDPDLAQNVAMTLLEFSDGYRVDAFGRLHAHVPPHPVDTLENALIADPGILGAEGLAALVLDVQTEGDFDRTVVQVMLGPDRARETWEGTLQRRRIAAQRGEAPIDLMLREHRRRGPDRWEDVADLLAGLAGPQPDVARIRTAIEVLGRAAAHAPSDYRPTVMSVLAWLHWAIGLGSCTARLLEESSRIDPRHDLTSIVRAITLAVMLPAWVAERDLRDDTDPSGLSSVLSRAARGRRRR